MPDLTGETLNNRYHIVTLLGRGGMAEVYQAWDQQRSVYLAMKLLRGDLSEDRVFLRREAYGYFLGLARWAQAGLPRVRLLPPATGAVRRGRQLVVALDDGLTARGGWESEAVKILSDSLVIKVNDRPVAFTPDLGNSLLRILVRKR